MNKPLPSPWVSAEIFPGGQRQHFADLCKVADDAMQMYVHESLHRLLNVLNSHYFIEDPSAK